MDDTVKINIEGMSIVYTLTLDVIKHGGTTDIGSYSGTAFLKQKMDAGGLSSEMVKVMGGVNTEIRSENVQIEIMKYDRGKYDNFGLTDEKAPLSLLTEPDGMALGAFTMSGKGNFNASADAPNAHGQLAFDKNETGELNYKINVEGGQVTVLLPQLNLPGSFKGMITGVPRN